MSGHRPFSELTRNWTPERRALNEANKAKFETKLVDLERLRDELGINDEELASLMDLEEPALSRLVQRHDLKLSTLRELIDTLGGELRIAATFDGRRVAIGKLSPDPA